MSASHSPKKAHAASTPTSEKHARVSFHESARKEEPKAAPAKPKLTVITMGIKKNYILIAIVTKADGTPMEKCVVYFSDLRIVQAEEDMKRVTDATGSCQMQVPPFEEHEKIINITAPALGLKVWRNLY